MKSITVKTQQELKKAIKEGYDEIIVPEKLGKKIMRAKKVRKLSPAAIAALIAMGVIDVGVTTVAPPVGLHFAAKSFVATEVFLGGLDIAAIALICGVGLTVLSVLWDEYSEVNVCNGWFTFKRRRGSKRTSKNDDSKNK